MSITDIFPSWWDFVILGICWVTMIIMVDRDQARELAAKVGTEIGCYSGGEWMEEVDHHQHFCVFSILDQLIAEIFILCI